MMRKLISAAMAVASATTACTQSQPPAPTPVHDNWQTTRWGMTEAQVKAAYPSSTYTTGGVTYDVRMDYQKGKLASVTLYPRDHYQCGDDGLKLSLDIRYGKGEITEGSGLTWKYIDSKRRNVILFDTDASGGTDAFCIIIYMPLDRTAEENAEIEASVSGL